MDWKDVGKIIAPLAPSLGSILGGLIPIPGGAIIGQQLGNIIARQFGVPATPEAVSDAIRNSELELAKANLNAATEKARLEFEWFREAEKQYYETIRLAIEQTGLTMREEIKIENRHWFFTGWRPASGWVFVIHAFLFGCVLLYAVTLNTAMLNTIDAAWKIFAAYFGILAAMVGVYVVARTTDKVKGVDTSTKPVVKK